MLLHELPVFSPRRQCRKKMRGFFRKVRCACLADKEYVPDIQNSWCNLAHVHLDWKGYGNFSERARGLFLAEYARRFAVFADAFSRQREDFQLWIFVFPYASGSDGIYYHSPNPHSEFPLKLDSLTWSSPALHMFSLLLPQYTLLEGTSGDGRTAAYYARDVGMPLS